MGNIIILHPTEHVTKRGPVDIESVANGRLRTRWTNGGGTVEVDDFNFQLLQDLYTPTQLGLEVQDPLLSIVRFGGNFLWNFAYYHAEGATLPSLDARGGLPADTGTYPNYPLWTPGITQAPLTSDNQKGHGNTLVEAEKAELVLRWKIRIHRLADFFERYDRAKKWAHESSGGDEIGLTLDATNTQRLNNTSRHWLKGIGMAWLIVSLVEDSTYSTISIPTSVRTDPNDSNSSVTIDTSTGAGIEEMLSALEAEYRMFASVEFGGNDANPLYTWHYAAGGTVQIAVWNVYYSSRQWWFTNYSTATGAYQWFSFPTEDAADWSALYDEFSKALGYLPPLAA